MKIIFINFFVILITLNIVTTKGLYGQTVSDMNEVKIINDSGTDQFYCTQDESEVLEAVEHFLFVAGNYNLEAMAKMMTENANVGIVRFKDGESVITTMTINEYFDGVKNRTTRPYFEPVLMAGRIEVVAFFVSGVSRLEDKRVSDSGDLEGIFPGGHGCSFIV